jgi:hypothetical protein
MCVPFHVYSTGTRLGGRRFNEAQRQERTQRKTSLHNWMSHAPPNNIPPLPRSAQRTFSMKYEAGQAMLEEVWPMVEPVEEGSFGVQR